MCLSCFEYKFTPGGQGSAYLIAGPSIGFKVGSSMSNNLLGIIRPTYDLDLNYKDVDFGGVAGLGYEIPVRGRIKGFVEATYRHSFTNAIGDIGILKVDSKTSNIAFSAGLTFPVGE
ncbi:MAG: PorT family protein [Leadbetterella sp.]|nr:PorT family protein [Leadbetterella sp.]